MSSRGKASTKGRGNPKRSLDNSKSEDLLDEEEEDDVVPAKKANKAAPKGRGKPKKEEEPEEEEDEEDDDLGEEEEDEEDDEDEEDSEAGDSEESNPDVPPREYGPRSFVVLKTDFNQGGDPPIWRIDGNSLLQKYTPFKDEDGTTLYKSTTVYSGWSVNNKESYYPAPVEFKRQDANDMIVHFDKSKIDKTDNKKDEK